MLSSARLRLVLCLCALGTHGLTSAACEVVPPSNPLDPDTPAEQQAKGSVVGRIVLDDPTAGAATLLAELGAVDVVLTDDEGREVLGDDGAPRTAVLETKEQDGVVSASFRLLEVTPGRYAVRVDGVGRRYVGPGLSPFEVAPGGVTNLGTLAFVAPVSEDGRGPGRISGAVRLEGGAGGARSVELFRRGAAGPELFASRRTDVDGAFSFDGLPVGSYALSAELDGFTPDYRLDAELGEGDGQVLALSFLGDDALVLHPVTAVLLPAVQQTEGVFYTREDTLPLSVLAFGGVSSMRLSTDVGFLDDAGAPLGFSPYSASANVPLPARQGVIEIFAQFEARGSEDDSGAFVFTSPVFSTSVVRDVTAPTLSAATPPGLEPSPDGSYFVTSDVINLSLDIDAFDQHSAVAGVAVVQPADGVEPDVADLVFVDVTSNGGAVRVNQPVPLAAGEGRKTAYVYVRDRAGNVSSAFPVELVTDTTAPSLPVLIANAEGGALRSRVAEVVFDETGAAELPVAMQVGVAPLRATDPVLPYASSVEVPVGGAHGSVVRIEARLFDEAGNSVVVQSDSAVLTLTATIAGRIALEAVPTLRADHGGVPVRVLPANADATTPPIVETVTAASGEFALGPIPEGEGYVLQALVAGYERSETLLPPLSANQALQLPTTSVRLARGALGGRFQLADQQSSTDVHGGILVVASLGGLDRSLVLTGVTTTDGTWRILDVPVTRLGEAWTVEGVAQGYARGTAGDVEVAEGVVSVVAPSAADPSVPDPVLLQPNSGDFDLCAPTGTCVPLVYTNLDQLRVRLRSSANVEQVRVRARVPFGEGDAEPPFQPLDLLNEPVVDITGDDGIVDVYVQVVVNGAPGPVLRSSVTRDTVPPTLLSFGIAPDPAALLPEFTRSTLVRATISSDPGTGNVAPLGSARLAFAAAAPIAPPVGATLCAHDVACDVPLPRVAGEVEEKTHTLFGFTCDVAGNCSATPANASVIFDKTPPSALHGISLVPTGPGIVTLGPDTFTRSSNFRVLFDLGAARTTAGDAVTDLAGQPVADALAYRVGLDPLLQGVAVVPFEGSPAAGSSRDVIGPALPGVDGTYTVFAQLVDAAGNRTAVEPNPFHFDLALDTTPPSTGFTLDGDAATTRSEVVTLSVSTDPLDPPLRVRIATDDGRFTTFLERDFPFAAGEDTFTLPAAAAPDGDGVYSVFARFFDAAGNATDRQDSIRLDRTPPSVRLVTCEACRTVDGALFTNAADRQVVLDVIADDAGGAVTALDVRVGAGATQRLPFGAPIAVVLPDDATHIVRVAAVDDAGNVSADALTAITLDRSAPSVTVAINDGATFAQSADVNITITATDAGSGANTVRLSSTAAFSSAPQPFIDRVPFRLEPSAVDGSKSVFVEVRDAAGNVTVASDTIVLDTTAPAGAAVIDGGAVFTTDRDVDVALTFPADTDGFALGEGGLDCVTATYTAATGTSATQVFTVTAGDGPKTIAACFRDAAGNTASATANITLDSAAPDAAVIIADGAAYTTTLSVGVELVSSPDTTQMSLSTNATPPDCASATYEAFAPQRTVTLPAGDGTKTVHACFKDGAGNTKLASSSIVLDGTAPTFALILDGGTTHTPSSVVTALLSASADVVAMALSTEATLNCATAVYEPFAATRQIALPAGQGARTVRACVKDGAGNTTQAQASITVDGVAPTVTATLAGGAPRIATASTTLSATVSEDIVFAIGVGALDCAAATYSGTFVSALPSTPVTLDATDGSQRVVVCVRDRAGNLGSTSATVVLDTTAPSATLIVNGGATHAASTSATAQLLDASADAASVFVTTGALTDCASVAPASFVPFASSLGVTLPAPDGAKQVRACLRDDVDNRRLLGPVEITLDRVAPTAPAGLNLFDNVRSVAVASGGKSRDAQPRFGWSASADADGAPVLYRLDISSDPAFALVEVVADTGEGRAFVPNGELADRTWHWRVTARDQAGNESTSAVQTFTVDRAAPQPPSIDAVAAFANSDVNVTWAAADTDTAAYQFELFRAPSTTPVLSFSTTTTSRNLRAGVDLLSSSQTGTAHIVRIRATDSVGNTSAASTVVFTYDTAAPCQLGSGTAVIRLNNNAGFVDGTQFTSSGSALVQVGCNGELPTRMRVSCDGGSVAGQGFVAYQDAFTCGLNTGTQGAKLVTVAVYDEAGNESLAPTKTLFFDDVAPSTPRFAATPGVVGTTTVTLAALALPSADPNGASGAGFDTTPYEVRATAVATALAWNGTTPLSVALNEGDNAIRVRAVDRAQNASDEDLIIVRRDTARPAVTNVVAEPGNGDVLVTWDSADTDIRRFEVLYGPIGSNNVADYTGTNADQGLSPVDVGTSTTVRLTGLPNGTPLFVAVRAFDDVGAGALTRQTASVTPNEVPLILASATASGDAGRARGVAWSDGIAFVIYGCDGVTSCASSGIRAFDVSDPESPTVIGSLLSTTGTFANALDIAILGDTAYVADGIRVRVVDIADPTSMLVRQSALVPNQQTGTDFAIAVAAHPGSVYVAAEREGLLVYDITTDTGLLSFRDSCHNLDGSCMFGASPQSRAVSVAVQGHYAYVGNGDYATGPRALEVVDVSNSLAPARAGTGSLTQLTAWDVEFHGDLLYLAQNGRLRVHDIGGGPLNTDLNADAAVARSSGQPVAVTVAGAYAYLVDTDGSTSIKVLSTENRPAANREMREVGSVGTDSQRLLNICDIGGGTFAVRSIACSPERIQAPSARLAVAGNLLLEATGGLGFVVYRIGRPVRAREVAHLPAATDGNFGASANGLGLAMRGRVLLNAGRTGLGLYRVDAAQPVTLGALSNPTDHHVLQLVDDTVYLARGSALEQYRFSSGGGTSALSIFEGWRLQDLGTVAYGNTKKANAMHVRWPFAYMLLSNSAGTANAGNELKVLNLRTGAVAATLALPDGAGFRDGSIAYHRNRLYITRSVGPDVTIVDVTSRSAPALAGAAALSGAAGVSVQGTQLYVGGFNKTTIFDLSNPAAPALLGSISSGGATLTASGDHVFSAREPRPVILNTLDPSAPYLVAAPGSIRLEEGVLVVGKHVYAQDRDELSIIELQ